MSNNSIVDPTLFKKLMNGLGVEQAQVYREINKVADKYNIQRSHASIKLASINGISITKYAGDEYYSAIQKSRVNEQILISPPPLPLSLKTPKPKITIKDPPVDVDLVKLPDNELRAILNRDVAELNCAIETGVKKTAKTCMVLSGSIAEALLLERLTRSQKIHNEAKLIAKVLPKGEKPTRPNVLETWTLAQLVNIASQLNPALLPSDSLSQIGQLRKWRNLIHPGRELKESAKGRIKPTKTRAKNSLAFLEFLASELN